MRIYRDLANEDDDLHGFKQEQLGLFFSPTA